MSLKILVTGGVGLIGYTLCSSLMKAGHKIICVDDLSTCRPENLKELQENFKELFFFVTWDVERPFSECGALQKILIEWGGIEQIYHLACPASPVWYQVDPVKTVRTNVLGTVNCLELARTYNARFLITSTSEIYGNPTEHPQSEDYCGNVNPLSTRSCYDEGKRVAETLTFDYKRGRQANVCIVRLFNTYGPGMSTNDGRVISNFVCQALRGDNITIYGDGSQTRSFCHVTDTVRGIRAAMDSKYSGPFNIGNPDERTVKELANNIVELGKSSSEIVYRELPESDPVRRCPDISRAKKFLNWNPEISLKDGLTEVFTYFEKVLKE